MTVYRGLNVMILNNVTGAVFKSQYFDILGSAPQADSFANYLNSTPQGYIVMISNLDHCGDGNMSDIHFAAMRACGAPSTFVKGSVVGR